MKDCNEIVDCSGRREFLVKAAVTTGGLVLTLSGAGSVFGNPFEDMTVTIDDKSPLKTIGGSQVVQSTAGKIIIVRSSEKAFVAFSARCTHKGSTVEYDAAAKQFVCPSHGSKFDSTNGNVSNGPAKVALKSYAANGDANGVKVTVS